MQHLAPRVLERNERMSAPMLHVAPLVLKLKERMGAPHHNHKHNHNHNHVAPLSCNRMRE